MKNRTIKTEVGKQMQQFEEKLFNGFSLIALVFLLSYAYIQFQQGYRLLGTLYIFAVLIIAFLRWYARKPERITGSKRILAGLGPIVLLPWQVTGGIEQAGLYWFFAYIVFIFAFLDRFWATVWLVVTYFGSFTILILVDAGLATSPFSSGYMLNVYYSSFITVLLMLVFSLLSERLKTELEALTTSYEEAQEIANIGSWRWDIKKDEVFWSTELKKIFEVNGAKKLNLKSYLQMIHEPDRENLTATINNSLQSLQPFEIDHRVKHSNGEIIWVHGRGYVTSNEENEPIFMSGTAQDITAQKKAEEALVRQNRQLAKLERITIGRELKMIELKSRLDKLQKDKASK